jgi:hypothetical protein
MTYALLSVVRYIMRYAYVALFEFNADTLRA